MTRLAQRLTTVPPGKYLAGLSGGADSVALLLALLTRREEWQLELEAVHVNHGLRGAASDKDESFCRELCGRAGIPLHVCRVDLEGRRDEDAARRARMECFRKLCLETGARGILLAHQQDDVAETFLMRLMRGAGPDGLGIMPAESLVGGLRILRPMLHAGREEIRAALRAEQEAWREDESNLDDRYLRNAVRNTLIPRMEQLAPGSVRHMAAAAANLAKDREYLNGEARTFLDHFPDSGWIRAKDLMTLPDSIRIRVLRLWWLRDGPAMEERQLNAGQTEALDRLLKDKKGKIPLPGGYTAVRTGENLHLVSPDKPALPETIWQMPEVRIGKAFRLAAGASQGSPGDGKRIQEVPEGFFDGCVIRSRQPGDWIRPFGSAGKKKLQDYLVDRKVDEPWRDRIPLICRGQEVLWCGGVGTGAVIPWDAGNHNIRLIWHGSMPWMRQGEENE